MADRIVVDPITRIEGHLRIEAELDSNNVISSAYSSGTQVRGIEVILNGRDPRDAWAFAQRVCGVCTTVHSFASIRAVEDALDIKIPKNANILRNLMVAQQFVHDHVMHFYHLHALDWVDIVSAATEGDPQEASDIMLSRSETTGNTWPNSSPAYFQDVKDKLNAIIGSGNLGLFAQGYWGHPAYKLPPSVNLLATAHYLEALDWQKDVVKVHAVLGGKNPHPNFLVGGVPVAIDPNGDLALNTKGLLTIKAAIDSMIRFTNEVYLPDLLAIAPFYPEWATYGRTKGRNGGPGNFLSWGEFPVGDPQDLDNQFVPRGVILGEDLNPDNIIIPDATDFDTDKSVKEYIAHSWYQYNDGPEAGLHPWEGETRLDYRGPDAPYTHLDVEEAYSWLKTPRFRDEPMEVGPLARVLLMFLRGNERTAELVTATLETLDAQPSALFSTLGRTAARGIESVVIAEEMPKWYNELLANLAAGDYQNFNGERWEPNTWPSEARGFGWHEAPRGALGHWVVIKDGKIDNYQMVVPTTWNASPRDHNGVPSAYETSLEDTPLAVPEQPLEILRTIHSFDPCMSCAVHLMDVDGTDLGEVNATPGLSCRVL